jgi:hypothetical protein
MIQLHTVRAVLVLAAKGVRMQCSSVHNDAS